jgi:hypothetical protein
MCRAPRTLPNAPPRRTQTGDVSASELAVHESVKVLTREREAKKTPERGTQDVMQELSRGRRAREPEERRD